MKALACSPAAETDIERIWDYSAENWGQDQADRYTDEIRDVCQMAATGEKRGRAVDSARLPENIERVAHGLGRVDKEDSQIA